MSDDYCFVLIPFKDPFDEINAAIESAVADATDDDDEPLGLGFRRGDTVLVQRELEIRLRGVPLLMIVIPESGQNDTSCPELAKRG